MTQHRIAQLLVTYGVVLVVVLLAGCSPRPAGGTAPPDDARPAAAGSSAAAVDLLTRSGTYQRNQNALNVAESLLVQACMKAAGLEYPIDRGAVTSASYMEREIRMAERSKHGYGLSEPKAETAGQSGGASASDRYVKSLSPADQWAYLRVLFGPDSARRAIEVPGGGQIDVPGTGCVAESRIRLYSDVLNEARVQYVPQAINVELAKQAQAASAYRTALKRWSNCMAGRGYAYPTPEAAAADLKDRFGSGAKNARQRKEEIAVAVADGECARRERLPLVALEVKRSLFGSLPVEEREALRELGEIWTRAAAEAEQVIRPRCKAAEASLPAAVCPKR
jgi:hypothetical protein